MLWEEGVLLKRKVPFVAKLNSMITEAENRFLERLYKMYGEHQAKLYYKERLNKEPPSIEVEDTSGYIDLNKL